LALPAAETWSSVAVLASVTAMQRTSVPRVRWPLSAKRSRMLAIAHSRRAGSSQTVRTTVCLQSGVRWDLCRPVAAERVWARGEAMGRPADAVVMPEPDRLESRNQIPVVSAHSRAVAGLRLRDVDVVGPCHPPSHGTWAQANRMPRPAYKPASGSGQFPGSCDRVAIESSLCRRKWCSGIIGSAGASYAWLWRKRRAMTEIGIWKLLFFFIIYI
jgi:hypothetical protein